MDGVCAVRAAGAEPCGGGAGTVGGVGVGVREGLGGDGEGVGVEVAVVCIGDGIMVTPAFSTTAPLERPTTSSLHVLR